MSYPKPIKWWSDSILPLVYDESLSYYEVLCKITTYINGIISDSDEIKKQIEDINKILENFNPEGLLELLEKVNELEATVNSYETRVADLEDDNTDNKTRLNNVESNVENLNKNKNSWNTEINGKIVFMGNSYGVDLYGYAPWPNRVADYLGAGNENDGWFNICGSGHSLTHENADYTFIHDITAFHDSHTSIVDDIGAIILVAGVNDSRPARSPLALQKLGELATYIKTNFPNAKLYNGFCGWWRGKSSNIGGRTLPAYGVVCSAYKQAKKFGWNYLTGIENIYHSKELIVDINPSGNDDGVHPTEEGQIQIANGVANAICCGSCGVTRHKITQFTALSTGDSPGGQLDEWVNDSTAYCKMNFACTYATNITLTVNQVTHLAMADSEFANQLDFAPIMILCLDANDGTTRVPVMCRIFVQNGYLDAQVKAILNGSNSLTVSRIFSAISIDCHPTISA